MAIVAAVLLNLSGEQLYQGLEAHHVLLKDGVIVLDARNWQGGKGEGRLLTDVLDLGGDDLLGQAFAATDVTVAVDCEAKSPAAAVVGLRSGTTYFQAPGTWSEWADVTDKPVDLKGRYVQVRVVLTSADAANLPKVKGLKVSGQRTPMAPLKSEVKVASASIEKIVRSTVDFGYERQDQADLAWMRKTFKLDEVVAGKKTELEKLLALNTWVASRKNNRDAGWQKSSHYPWNIREVLSEANGGTISGHCGSYCEVFITAAASFGWQGRHIADEGFKRRSHEVPEIWVNELKKWVYFDPSLDGAWYEAKTGVPLNALEMHNVFLQTMYPGGIVQGTLNEDEQKVKNKAINWSTFPAVYKSALWAYGEKNQEPTFWQWGQGLMTCGWMQMTPRNNFHSKPQPYFTQFGHGPGSNAAFPYWVNAQTGFRNKSIRNWHTRPRDWYWTLNQASMRLVRTADDAVTVELGTSQPFFKRFIAAVNGGKPETVASPYVWTLKPGDNTLEINCEDEFGTTGIPSKIVLALGK